jgi:two-component system chemotaxis response regulator CheY
MKILVVDDSKVMRQIVVRTLRQAGFVGHDVQEASDGSAALQIINSAAPDLVLTDWNMPELPGIELLRSVRSAGKQIPFVFVTSEGTEEMKSLAIQEGALGLITKPFTAETFQTALQGVIS